MAEEEEPPLSQELPEAAQARASVSPVPQARALIPCGQRLLAA